MAVRVSASELKGYVGTYSRPFMDVIVTADTGRLLIQRIQKRGFPSASSLVPPPVPSVPYVFYARDRLTGREAAGGDRAEFLRESNGNVTWIRIGGRIARRVAGSLPDRQ